MIKFIFIYRQQWTNEEIKNEEQAKDEKDVEHTEEEITIDSSDESEDTDY